MINLLLYDFVKNREYTLKKFVDDYEKNILDDLQGIIFQEYDDEYLKATYWLRKKKMEYKYNIEKEEFEKIESEVVNVVEFIIQIQEKKMFIFGNKQMAQRIVTLINVISKNSYSIMEYIIDIKKMVEKICQRDDIELLKMKLIDITLEKGILVNCNVNLLNQDNPIDIIHKYVSNIVAIAFKFEKINIGVTVYKTGKILLSKNLNDDKEDIIQKIIKIAC